MYVSVCMICICIYMNVLSMYRYVLSVSVCMIVCIACIACIAYTCGGDGARAASAGAWSGSAGQGSWWSAAPVPASESILRGLSFRPDSESESVNPGSRPSGRPRSCTRPDARGPRPDQPLCCGCSLSAQLPDPSENRSIWAWCCRNAECDLKPRKHCGHCSLGRAPN